MPTYTCPSCKSCFSEADKQWDIAIAFAKCPNCLMSLRDFPVPINPEKLQPIGAADSVQPSGVPSAPRFCTSCGAPTRASARFCTKCGCALNFPVGSNRHEDTPPAQQPKQQEGKPATQQPYPWGSVLTWAFLAFLLGLTTARPTWKSATAFDQSVLGVFIGTAYAAITAIIVGAYKYFRRNPSSQFLGSCTWTRVTVEEAKKHPLYGVRGWLAFFAFSTLIGFAQTVTPVNVEAIKAGVSLGTLLSLDMPEAIFLKWVLWIHGLIVVAIYGLLFSKHPSFRPVSTYLLLGFWPTVALAGLLNPFSTLGEVLVLSFIPWALYCATWVTYLQKSKRVRVTFERSVKAGQDNVADTSLAPFSHKPAVTRELAQERQFNDASRRAREQVPPSRKSKDISPLQPTVKPTAPISISAKPNQNTAEAHEDRLYAQIAQELDTNTVDKALWTKVYAQAGGDEKQTRVLYIKARFARLSEIEDA